MNVLRLHFFVVHDSHKLYCNRNLMRGLQRKKLKKIHSFSVIIIHGFLQQHKIICSKYF